MTARWIPCTRPRVTIEPHVVTRDDGFTWTKHLVTCHVPGCRDFTYDASVVTDAQDQARWHRARHREAVPVVAITRLPHEPYRVECKDCAFVRSDGTTTTRGDAEIVKAHHLTKDHGLVVCR